MHPAERQQAIAATIAIATIRVWRDPAGKPRGHDWIGQRRGRHCRFRASDRQNEPMVFTELERTEPNRTKRIYRINDSNRINTMNRVGRNET